MGTSKDLMGEGERGNAMAQWRERKEMLGQQSRVAFVGSSRPVGITPLQYEELMRLEKIGGATGQATAINERETDGFHFEVE